MIENKKRVNSNINALFITINLVIKTNGYYTLSFNVYSVVTYSITIIVIIYC